MDQLFQRSSERLVELLGEINELGKNQEENTGEEARLRRKELIRSLVKAAERVDTIYAVATEGFEKENRRVSEQIFQAAQAVFNDVEEKEVLLKEAREMIAEARPGEASIGLDDLLEYGARLARYSKCPLLWSEEIPLERSFPAFPTDGLIQQSVLGRGQTPKKEEKRRKKTDGVSEPAKLPPPAERAEFTFEF